jgi:hypothetical protein
MTSAGQPQTTPAAPAEADRAGAVLHYQSDLARHRDRAADIVAEASRHLSAIVSGMSRQDPGRDWTDDLRACSSALAYAAGEQAAFEALRAHDGLARLAAQPAPDPAAAWPNAGRA